MFIRTIMVISTAIVVATPAVAKFEPETGFGYEISDFLTPELSLSDPTACGQMIDVLDGYKAFLGKDTYEEDKNSLLTILTGNSPDHQYLSPLSLVACN